LIDGVLITLVYLVFSGIFLSSLAGSDISYSNDANGNLIPPAARAPGSSSHCSSGCCWCS